MEKFRFLLILRENNQKMDLIGYRVTGTCHLPLPVLSNGTDLAKPAVFSYSGVLCWYGAVSYNYQLLGVQNTNTAQPCCT